MEEVGLWPAGDAHALGLDAVIAAQVVLHDAVLDDVEVAVRRDDALADRVVPARDVRDHREPQPTGGSEERHRARGLDVREHEGGAVAPHRLEQPPRDVPPRAEEPALHRPLERRPARERAVAVGVEHPVRVARLHPLGMEAMPVVQPDRERVVAELAVEPASIRARARGRQARARRRELVAVQHRRGRGSGRPFRRLLARHEEDGGERARRGARGARSTIPVSKKTRIES